MATDVDSVVAGLIEDILEANGFKKDADWSERWREVSHYQGIQIGWGPKAYAYDQLSYLAIIGLRKDGNHAVELQRRVTRGRHANPDHVRTADITDLILRYDDPDMLDTLKEWVKKTVDEAGAPCVPNGETQ